MADYGATLAFDDCEALDKGRANPDKRALMLAGNRRGTVVTVKEPKGERGWTTRSVHAFCPRLFSAIGLPDDVLGSRCITVPLIRSLDDGRAKVDPLDHATWPHTQRQLVDDLWALGLAHVARVHGYDGQAAKRARLVGRDLDPWRGVLAVALWLQEEASVSGLFDRMEVLSVTYQAERAQLETGDDVRLLVLALKEMLGEHDELEFDPSTLAGQMNELARADDLVDRDVGAFTNPQRVGRLLHRHRFHKAQRTAKRKRWRVTRSDLTKLAQSYGLEVRPARNTETVGTTGNMASPPVPSCQVCQVPGDSRRATVEELVATVEHSLEALKERLHGNPPGS